MFFFPLVVLGTIEKRLSIDAIVLCFHSVFFRRARSDPETECR